MHAYYFGIELTCPAAYFSFIDNASCDTYIKLKAVSTEMIDCQ